MDVGEYEPIKIYCDEDLEIHNGGCQFVLKCFKIKIKLEIHMHHAPNSPWCEYPTKVTYKEYPSYM